MKLLLFSCISDKILLICLQQNQTVYYYYGKENKMKKMLILTMMVLFSVPVYSGCWKMDKHKYIFTGGIGSMLGGSAAYGDSTFYYLEHTLVGDTVKKIQHFGSLFWRTRDAGTNFELFAGYINNNHDYETDSIADGYEGQTLNDMHKVVLHDTNRIYVAGESNELLVSKDAGKTWEVRQVMLVPNSNPSGSYWRTFNDFDTHPSGLGVFCFDQIRVPWSAPKLYDTIAITTDDWKTSKWLNVGKGDTSVYLTRVCIADSNTIYCSGGAHINGVEHPVIIKSSDKGNTWTYIFLDNPEVDYRWFNSLNFIDKNIGWIAGSDRKGSNYFCTIYKTTDGGLTWKQQMHDDYNNFRGIPKIQFANDKVGFALGNCGGFTESDSTTDLIAFRTKDGGDTWIRILPDSLGYEFDTMVDLAVGSPTNAYIVIGWYLFKYDDNCEVSGAEEHLPPMPEELKSFPNPIGSNRSAKLQLGNTYGDNLEGVYLYDSRGLDASAHISYTLTSSGELNFKLDSDLARGTYMITVQFGINRVKYCKIIVE